MGLLFLNLNSRMHTFSSAKDPVNMLSNVAQNMLECGLGTTQWQVKEYFAADNVFVPDLRKPRNGRFIVLKPLCTFCSISYLIGWWSYLQQNLFIHFATHVQRDIRNFGFY